MILTIDVETTGLPKDRGASLADSKAWPHIVGLTFLVSEDDGSGIDEYMCLISPDGYSIPADATAIHGITTAVARKYGYSSKAVLALLNEASHKCHTVVGHGLTFDYNVIMAEYYRLGYEPEIMLLKQYCTMERSTDFCNLPSKYDKPKWPKLVELHTILFGEPFTGAHDSSVDARMTLKCYTELKKRGI